MGCYPVPPVFRALLPRSALALMVCALFFALARQASAQNSITDADAGRFLEQAAFGPAGVTDPSDPNFIGSVAHVEALGSFAAWLNEQFNLALPSDYVPMETCPTSTGRCPAQPPTGCDSTNTCPRDNYTMYQLQARFFNRALSAPDQLRQRVAFALNQILVISAQDGDLNRLNRMQPYIQVLETDAFTNYRTILKDITLNGGMGSYLNMVNNNKSAPNENYAREINQLFSIGLNKINPDGTPVLDGGGNLIPTYTQDTVTNFARVFTGWTFQVQPNPPEPGYINYIDPMRVGNENNHDQLPKTLLDHGGPGCSPPGGENAAPELDEALDCIMSSPYIAPYIGKNLIQHLVTSNPSPTYVSDVSTAFTTGSFTDPASGITFGSGTVGDMQAVIAAILLDPEARGNTAPSPYAGHLKEPVLFITNLLRAFNTTSAGNTTDNVLGESFLPSDVVMSEDVYRSPSVFNFFPPGNAIAGENSCGISGSDPCLGPEFEIQDTSTSLARINLAYEIVFHTMPTNTNRPVGTWIDEGTLFTLGSNDPQTLVDTLNGQMIHGSMTSDMNARIVSAVSAITNADPAVQALSRAREAVYLIASSSEYNVGR